MYKIVPRKTIKFDIFKSKNTKEMYNTYLNKSILEIEKYWIIYIILSSEIFNERGKR